MILSILIYDKSTVVFCYNSHNDLHNFGDAIVLGDYLAWNRCIKKCEH